MLNGLWVLTSYVDSILENKTISKYRIQNPAWFAILIEIDNDTVRSYGSIVDDKSLFQPRGDTLHLFKKTLAGHWLLTINKETNNLELRNTDTKSEKLDTTVYVFEKRPDLQFLLDTLDKVHYTCTSFRNYFQDQLFAGTYEVIGTGKQVTFYPNGDIKGLQDFYKYRVDVYFGTLHPYNNLDNVIFYRNRPQSPPETNWEVFNWKIKGDTLILTLFKWEEFEHEGEMYRDEMWELSKEQIKLKRKKKK